MPAEKRASVEELMKRLMQLQETAAAKTVFGEPMTVNGRTIIPVASVRYMFGFGMGRGVDRAEKDSGEGGGGGGGAMVRPVALLEISGNETRLKPIVDVNRQALAGIALAAWSVFWITLTIRALARRR